MTLCTLPRSRTHSQFVVSGAEEGEGALCPTGWPNAKGVMAKGAEEDGAASARQDSPLVDTAATRTLSLSLTSTQPASMVSGAGDRSVCM